MLSRVWFLYFFYVVQFRIACHNANANVIRNRVYLMEIKYGKRVFFFVWLINNNYWLFIFCLIFRFLFLGKHIVFHDTFRVDFAKLQWISMDFDLIFDWIYCELWYPYKWFSHILQLPCMFGLNHFKIIPYFLLFNERAIYKHRINTCVCVLRSKCFQSVW